MVSEHLGFIKLTQDHFFHIKRKEPFNPYLGLCPNIIIQSLCLVNMLENVHPSVLKESKEQEGLVFSNKGPFGQCPTNGLSDINMYHLEGG